MPGIALPLRQRAFGETSRRDSWWLTPLGVFLGLSAFIVYSTWAALQGNHYWLPGTNYLSPFYSPELWGHSPHAIFGTIPSWWPGWLPYSPALLILWAPGGFRFTARLLDREAEIEDLDPSVRGDEQIGWFDVAVDDAFFVGGREAGGHLPGKVNRF